MLGKSTINDGGLVLSLSMTSNNYGRLALSLSMTSINNGGLVMTFEAPFDKPMLGWLFQYFHLYFRILDFFLAYLNSATLQCKTIILAKLASFLPAKLARSARIEVVKLPSINDGLLIYLVTFHDNWMDPIIAYLKEEKLPEDKFKGRNLILKI